MSKNYPVRNLLINSSKPVYSDNNPLDYSAFQSNFYFSINEITVDLSEDVTCNNGVEQQ